MSLLAIEPMHSAKNEIASPPNIIFCVVRAPQLKSRGLRHVNTNAKTVTSNDDYYA